MKKQISKSLFFCCFVFLLCYYSVGLDISRMQIEHPSGAGEIFHGGVYSYASTTQTDTLMENHIRLMSQHGMTHQYIAFYNEVITADEILQWCNKYGMYVSFQHGNGYYIGNETQTLLETKAGWVASFIGDYMDDPAFLTCSVKEEPSDTDAFIDGLFSYYDLINTAFDSYYGGYPPLYLLHTTALERASEKTFKPLMTGTDRTYVYQYRFDVPYRGAQGYLSTPRKALNTVNKFLGQYREFIDGTQWPVAVLLGAATKTSTTKAYLQSTYGTTAYDRWLALAQYNNGEGNHGLKENGDYIDSWGPGFYMPPENCLRCQAWLAVARGYRGVFLHKSDPKFNCYHDVMGADHKGTDLMDEYGETVRELQKYGWLINRMEYQEPATPYISYTDDPIYTIYSGDFTIPSYNGKITVLVNADVGTWNGSDPLAFADSDVFRIDADGFVNLSDYTPKTSSSRGIQVTNNVSETNMYDLETGTLIGSSSGTCWIWPGRGRFIFIGNSTELAEIRAKCGITTITAHSGLVPNRETIPDDIQIVYPVDPIADNSSYQLINTLITHNNRYRAHVTASSTDGAQLGVLVGYYDGSWHTYHINTATDNTDIWNKSLTSVPTTFVSKDFTVTQGTIARFYIYRSNQSGTIKIENAWLEDCNTHREITAEWIDTSISHQVNSGEVYQIYARVRNYPYTNTQFNVKIYEYDVNNNLLGTYYDTTPAIWNEALSEYPTVFKGKFQKNNASADHVKVKFKSGVGGGTFILESACVGQVQ